MTRTYLNEHLDVPYPFVETASKLPFPYSCITALSICLPLPDEVSDLRVKASCVTIGPGLVHVALCNAANAYLGSVAVLGGDKWHSGKLVPAAGVDASGFMCTGTIPESAYGVYKGAFWLDRSCVSYMAREELGNYATVTIGAHTYSCGESLSLDFGGLLFASPTSSGALIGETLEAEDAELVQYTDMPDYTTISSINSVDVPISTTSSGAYALKLSSTSGGISFSAVNTIPEFTDPDSWDRTSGGHVVEIRVVGDKTFPNCYAADQDNAGE